MIRSWPRPRPFPGCDRDHPSRDNARGTGVVAVAGFGAAIGIPAAFLAALFLALVHYLQQWLWHDLPDALNASSSPWYLVIGLPVASAALVWAARALLPGDGGRPPLLGLGTDPTPLRYAPGLLIAAIGTLGFGAVLGPNSRVSRSAPWSE